MTKYKINCGIGDSIVIKSQLLQIKPEQEYFISPNLDVVNIYGNPIYNNEYVKFIYSFMSCIFHEERFHITMEQRDYKYKTAQALENEGYIPEIIDLRDCLVGECEPIGQPYCTISTKVRGVERTHFEKIKNQFFYAINSLNCAIVIVGERNVSDIKEYNGNPTVHSLYEYLVTEISPDKLIDKTVESVQIPSLYNIKKDCCLLANSVNNILFGIGGNLSLTNSVGKCISFLDTETFEYRMYRKSLENAFNKTEKHRLLYSTPDYIDAILNINEVI